VNHRPAGPRVGDRAHEARRFVRGADSRLPPPPRGQEYRVMDSHVVLVDRNTLAVVTVIGLLGNLLR